MSLAFLLSTVGIQTESEVTLLWGELPCLSASVPVAERGPSRSADSPPHS